MRKTLIAFLRIAGTCVGLLTIVLVLASTRVGQEARLLVAETPDRLRALFAAGLLLMAIWLPGWIKAAVARSREIDQEDPPSRSPGTLWSTPWPPRAESAWRRLVFGDDRVTLRFRPEDRFLHLGVTAAWGLATDVEADIADLIAKAGEGASRAQISIDLDNREAWTIPTYTFVGTGVFEGTTWELATELPAVYSRDGVFGEWERPGQALLTCRENSEWKLGFFIVRPEPHLPEPAAT